jgi:F-type H+-transporting ATPase subunit b
MSVLASITVAAGNALSRGGLLPQGKCGVDDEGTCVSENPIIPEKAEWIYGGLASLLIFAALAKFALPAIKKSMAARTERIQKELDGAASAKASAETDAADIRSALGDIESERSRLLADADSQAAAIVEDGRARVAAEMADIEAKAMADISASNSRVGDELRAEIARLSSAAVDHVVTGSLDEATHQELIESFITKVGAGK